MTNDGSHSYQSDAEGRLSSVDSGSTWWARYNALGERAEWISSGEADQHLFDPWGTWLGNAGEYSTLPALGHYRALYINGEAVYLHRNNLGSSQTQTDYSGTQIQDMAFYPWGQVWWRAQQGTGWGFAGMPYWDVNTNTSFTQFREYSMNVGRWYSPDPLGGEVMNPQSLNRYAYVLNNPTTFIDPLGLKKPVLCEVSTVVCQAVSGAVAAGAARPSLWPRTRRARSLDRCSPWPRISQQARSRRHSAIRNTTRLCPGRARRSREAPWSS